jgi:hypothetical protein
MPWTVWLALLFLLVVNVVGIVVVGREGLAAWRAVKAFSAFMERASVALGTRLDEVARKADAASDVSARLAEAIERLSRSTAYAQVLVKAVGTARGAARRAQRLVVPGK